MSDTTAAAPASDASAAENAESFHRHFKGYLFIGSLQILFTFVAVILSFVVVEMHAKIVSVLLAASINAAIVALIQMHLKSEKAMIFRFLFFTAIFFVAIFFLSLLHWFDPIVGSHIHH